MLHSPRTVTAAVLAARLGERAAKRTARRREFSMTGISGTDAPASAPQAWLDYRQYALDRTMVSIRMDRISAAVLACLAVTACLAVASCGDSSGTASPRAHLVARSASTSASSRPGLSSDPNGKDDSSHGRTFRASEARNALARFASCMRTHGVHLPPPDTASNGPIFDTRGVSTTGRVFTAALSLCRRELAPTLRQLRQTAPVRPRPPTDS